jgi:hypothetical protein
MGKTSLSIYMKGYYEDFQAFERKKNKANSNPNKANFRRDYVFGCVRIEIAAVAEFILSEAEGLLRNDIMVLFEKTNPI